jgi:hypothetical protein
MDNLARQHKIWRLLRKKLTNSEQAKVLDFLAYTPEEDEAYSNSQIDSSICVNRKEIS